MSKRIKVSEKNSLIEEYRNGIHNKDFRVVPNKNKKGQYFIRKRKAPLTDEEIEEYDQEVVDYDYDNLNENSNINYNPNPNKEKMQKDKKKNKEKTNLTYNGIDPTVLTLQNLLQQQVLARIDNLEYWKNKQKLKKQTKKERKRMQKNNESEIIEEVIVEEEDKNNNEQTYDSMQYENTQMIEDNQVNVQEPEYYTFKNKINYSKFGF